MAVRARQAPWPAVVGGSQPGRLFGSPEAEFTMAQPSFDRPASIHELTEMLLATASFEEYTQEVVDLAAARVLPGSSCGMTVRMDGRPLTVANSDDFAARLDELQYGAGEGPCLKSMETGRIVLVHDLTQDRRWGNYRLHALAHGARASLSMPIASGDGAIGELNFYATAPNTFTDAHAVIGAHFADQAAGALRLAARLADQTILTAQLQEAMSSRTVIDQAIGIVMGQNRCDADAAFDVLRRASQNRNIKLRQVAADLVGAVSARPASPATTMP